MADTEEWTVYIIQTKSGKLYTGITKDLERRFDNHRKRQKGARFFHISAPQKVVFQERYANRSGATKREIQIKKMSRVEKQALIGKHPKVRALPPRKMNAD